MSRNVVTLSHLDPELHEWLKDEASRRSKDGARVSLSRLVEEAVRRFKADCEQNPEGGPGFYLRDGQGPFADVQTALEALGIPPDERPKHNRYERLSEKLKCLIIKKNNHEEVLEPCAQ
ncbi:hypothetical protein ES703_08924 [subsurface metagenome]